MNQKLTPATARFLLSCPDTSGVVASVADFIAQHGGNIIHAEQHTDQEVGIFFQRVEFSLDGFNLGREKILSAFGEVSKEFNMNVSLKFSDENPKVAILCSKEGHCLYDLLGRWHRSELDGTPAFVAGNHTDLKNYTESLDIPFHHLPVSKETKPEQEDKLLKLLEAAGVELVVMARYMQILSADFLGKFKKQGGQIINIHHSFLPAFPGASPYKQAHERGVKIVGATAHYATAELDEGPIISQDVVRVGHRDSVADLIRKGRDLEMVVLADAVRAHLEHRVLDYNNKTVVFS